MKQLRDGDPVFIFYFHVIHYSGYNNYEYERKEQDDKHSKCLGHECIYTQRFQACTCQTKVIVDTGECEDANINQDKPNNKIELLTSQEKKRFLILKLYCEPKP